MPPRLGMSQLGGGLRHHRPLPARREKPLPWVAVGLLPVADRNAGEQRYADAVQLLRSASEMAGEGLDTLEKATLFAVKVLLGCAFVPGLPMTLDLGSDFPGLLNSRTCEALFSCVERFLPRRDWLDARLRIARGSDCDTIVRSAPAGYLEALDPRRALILMALAACAPWPLSGLQVQSTLLEDVQNAVLSADRSACTAALAALPLAWGQGVAPASGDALCSQLDAFAHVRVSALVLREAEWMEKQGLPPVHVFLQEWRASLAARAAADAAPRCLPACAAVVAAHSSEPAEGQAVLRALRALCELAEEVQDDYTAMWAHAQMTNALVSGFDAPAGEPPAAWTPAQVAPHARRVLQAEGRLRAYGGARLLSKYAVHAVDLLCLIGRKRLVEDSSIAVQPNPPPPRSTAALWVPNPAADNDDVCPGGGGNGSGSGESGGGGTLFDMPLGLSALNIAQPWS